MVFRAIILKRGFNIVALKTMVTVTGHLQIILLVHKSMNNLAPNILARERPLR